MTSHRRFAARTTGRLAATAKGALAVAALAALLVGIPLMLFALGADPRTVQPPTIARARQLLTSPDDGTLLIGALRVVAWTAWAVLVLSVTLETAAAVAGRAAPALRGFSAVQQPAAYLVATITAALATSTTAAAAVPVQTAAHAAAIPGPPSGAALGVGHRSDAQTSARDLGGLPGSASVLGWGAPHAEQATPRPGGLPAVRVGRYDSLWRIAERQLGDGHRWSEIYRLNTDRAQPGGGRLIDPDTILEGWTLLLPADAAGTGTRDRDGRDGSAADSTATDGHPGQTIVVRAGDTLSGLAERRLSTARATRALYDANAGRLQPDGQRLTDPDLLRPGWRLVLPAPNRSGSPVPPQAPVPPHTPVPPRAEPVPHTTPTLTTAPAPTATEPGPSSSPPASSGSGPGSDGSTSTTPTAGRASASPAPAIEQPDRDFDSWVRLPSGSVLGLGLAATVAGLLALVRRRRRQHRIPGDPSTSDSSQPPLPAAAQAVEAAWLATRRQAHDPGSLSSQRFDGEYLTHGDESLDDHAREPIATASGDRSDPELHSDDLGDDGDLTNGLPGGLSESLLVASAHTAAVGSAGVTTMPRGETAGGEPAPTLLALTGPPTAAVMAEAAWSGGVGLIGPGAAGAARAVLARLLTGSGPMGGLVFTTEETVAELLPAGAAEGFSMIPGVTVFATTAAALTAVEAELLGRNRRLDDAGVDTLTDYRRLPDGEPVPAVLLLSHAPSTPGLTARAAAGLTLGRDREVGAVWLGSWPPATITVSTTGALALTDTGSPVGQAENLLPADTADLLAALLPGVRDALDVLDPTTLATHIDHESTAVDEDGADAAAAVLVELPAESDGDRWGLAGDAVLEVAVLGRVRVTVAGGGEVTGLRAKVRELLALLAVHPDGLSTDQISEALWPEAPPGRASNRLSPILAQTRRLLREAAHLNGDPATDPQQDQDSNSHSASAVDLVPLTDGRYRLHPVLLDTDYRRFTAGLAAAADAGNDSGDGDESYRAALQAAANSYRGEPFDGADYSWAEPIRESLRRQATDALAALAESLTPDNHSDKDPGARSRGQLDRPEMDPVEALTALERAIEVDPYNEELYRRIMRLHGGAGRRDAVRRTMRLLEARLLDLDTDPDPATLALAADLLRPRRSRTAAGRYGGART